MSNVYATKDYDPMKVAIRCKYCGKPEYYGEFRWLSGKMLCRNCYKAWWEGENKQPYKWDDLDGERPTEVDREHMSPSRIERFMDNNIS